MSYIDLHAHVLPGVDDGAETLEASLMMLRMASEHGTKALAVTPHGAGVTKTQYLGKFERLKAAAARESLPVKLFFGMEMMADGTLFDRLQSGDVQPLGESRFLLTRSTRQNGARRRLNIYENTGMCRSSHTRSGTSFCKTNLGARSCGQSGGPRCR